MKYFEVLKKRLRQGEEVLVEKAKEYAHGNRYQNFMDAAKLSKIPETPQQALYGMLRKHLQSVIDAINKNIGVDRFDEKFGDVFNYLILLIGMERYTQDLKSVLDSLIMIIDSKIMNKDCIWKKFTTHSHLLIGEFKEHCINLQIEIELRTFKIEKKAMDLLAYSILIEGLLLSRVYQETKEIK